jgi:hypothetical protein
MMPYEVGWMQPLPVRGANSTVFFIKNEPKASGLDSAALYALDRYMSNVNYVLDRQYIADMISMPPNHDRPPD